MTRSRSLIALACVAAFAASAVALAQGAEPSTADLLKKIEALEKRITTLEATRAAAPAAAPAANTALETEAQAALNQINALVGENKYDEAKVKMSEFMKKYGATNTARAAQRMQAELDVIGKPAPAKWGIEEWYQGENDIDLTNGKPTLLVFWELWCPHCKREVPKLQEVYNSLKGEGLQMVGLTRLSKNQTEEAVKSFCAEQKVSYPVAKEDGTVASHFGVSGIPAAAIIKDGKVVWRGHPARLSETMLKAYL